MTLLSDRLGPSFSERPAPPTTRSDEARFPAAALRLVASSGRTRLDRLMELEQDLTSGQLRRAVVTCSELLSEGTLPLHDLPSYLHEMLVQIETAEETWGLEGLRPSLLTSFARALIHHRDILDRYPKATTVLRAALAMQLRGCGASRSMWRLTDPGKGGSSRGNSGPDGVGAVVEVLASIRRRTRRWLEPPPGSCVVPVVESGSGRAPLPGFAMLQVRFFGFHEGPDELYLDAGGLGAGARRDFTVRVAAAVRRMLARDAGLEARRGLLARIGFEGGGLFSDARSASLAAAMLLADRIRAQVGQPESRDRRDVAITGDLDAQGRIQAVDARSLPMKVEAVLYSPLRGLVAPPCQVDAARAALADLGVDGDRDCAIIPARLGARWERSARAETALVSG